MFSELPPGIELFDRGISRGDIPRLWIDAIAHVEMGRDKRMYRFVQDSRFGRQVLAVEAGDTALHKFGLAIDIGTTSVVTTLMELESGEQLAAAHRRLAARDLRDRVWRPSGRVRYMLMSR